MSSPADAASDITPITPSPNSTPAPGATPLAFELTTPVDGRWDCSPKAIGLDEKPTGELEQLTVGTKFALVCEGDTVGLDRSKVALKLPKQDKYSLRLLRVQELGDNGGVLTVTTYKVGESELKAAVLTDGTKSVALSDLRLKVASVIDPKENPENKPYAPAPPVPMPLPVWIWVALGAVVAVLLAWGLGAWRKSSQNKRLLAELARHGTALTPYNQFNKDVRAINRNFPLSKPSDWSPTLASQYIDELNRAFRWYLAREFVVPAFQRTPSGILRDIRRKNKSISKAKSKALDKRMADDLRLALRELSRGEAAREKLSVVDGQQLLDLCRKVADEIERQRREASA